MLPLGTVPMGRRCGDGRVDGARFGDHGLSALRGTQWGQHRAVAELSAPSCTKMCTDPICSAAHPAFGQRFQKHGWAASTHCVSLGQHQPARTDPPPGAAGWWWWWWWEGAELSSAPASPCAGTAMGRVQPRSAAIALRPAPQPCFLALLTSPAVPHGRLGH